MVEVRAQRIDVVEFKNRSVRQVRSRELFVRPSDGDALPDARPAD
jgi:hypothetical protein